MLRKELWEVFSLLPSYRQVQTMITDVQGSLSTDVIVHVISIENNIEKKLPLLHSILKSMFFHLNKLLLCFNFSVDDVFVYYINCLDYFV